MSEKMYQSTIMTFNKAVVVLCFYAISTLTITHESITFDRHRYLLSHNYFHGFGKGW
jgi:membrane protein YdbS with pleckstrin-like domain